MGDDWFVRFGIFLVVLTVLVTLLGAGLEAAANLQGFP